MRKTSTLRQFKQDRTMSPASLHSLRAVSGKLKFYVTQSTGRKRLAALLVGMSVLLSACTQAPSPEPPKAAATFSYPMNTEVTLTFFTAPLVAGEKSYEQTTWHRNMEKATGIRVQYLHPPLGEENEALQKLIASRALPDLIRSDWISYPGGADKAINDQIILRLNPILPIHSPNLWGILQKNPQLQKHYTSESNQYFEYPLVYQNAETSVHWGAILRKDWLQELSLPVPLTVDDWTVMLRRFQKEKGAAAPFSFACYTDGILPFGFLSGAYGIATDFYLDEAGVVRYGFIEPAYKDFLLTLRGWYQEGLLDPNIASIDRDAVRYKMIAGDTGAILGSALEDIPYLMENRTSQDFDIVGARYPVLEIGQKPFFGQGGFGFEDPGSVAIGASCRYIEEAARYLDFAYTKEGRMLNTFGIEGEDYKLEDGKPTYLFKPSISSGNWDMRVNWQFPGLKNNYWDGIPKYGQYPQQEEALKNFRFTDYQQHLLPSLSYQDYEAMEITALANKIQSYVHEMYLKFMFGDAPIDQFDNYVQTVWIMGIEKVLTAKNEALKRYQGR